MWISALLSLSLLAPTLIKTGPRLSKTTAADWARHPDDHDYYTESWNALIKADDGHVIYLSFLYTNIGVMSGRSGVNISISAPGGVNKAYQWEHDTDDFSFKSGTITIKKNHFKLRGRDAELLIKEGGFKLDVKIKGALDGFKVHSGKVFLDGDQEEYVQTFFHIPRGALEGTMRFRGKDYPLKGIAYIDHWNQNVLGGDYSTRWFNIRAFGEKHTFISLMWRYKEDYGEALRGWAMIADGDRIRAVSDRVKLRVKGSRKDPKGYRYATALSVNFAAGGIKVNAQTEGRLRSRMAVMEQMSWAQRQVAKMVAGNPIFYRLDGGAKLRIERDGQAFEEDAPALMESIVMDEEG